MGKGEVSDFNHDKVAQSIAEGVVAVEKFVSDSLLWKQLQKKDAQADLQKAREDVSDNDIFETKVRKSRGP